MNGQSKLIGPQEVMRRIGIGKSTLYRMINKNELPQHRKIGNLTKWLEEDIERYIVGQANQTTSS